MVLSVLVAADEVSVLVAAGVVLASVLVAAGAAVLEVVADVVFCVEAAA